MSLPKTQLSDAKSMHARLRYDCEKLWETRGRKDFRLVRSCSWNTYGRGMGWYWMRKFGDTFVIGVRKERALRSKYPDIAAHREGLHYTPDSFSLKFDDPVSPLEWFWRDPFFIVKPDRTYMPINTDQTLNNTLAGMGYWGYQMTHNSALLRYPTATRLGIAFLRRNGTMVSNALEFDSEGVHSRGIAIRDPMIQVYDKGIYNQGVEALSVYRKLLHFYAERHNLIDTTSHMVWGYEIPQTYLWQIVNQYQKHGADGLSPQWIVDRYQKTMQAHINKVPSFWRKTMLSVPLLPVSALYRAWRYLGLEYGFCRFATRGAPLYNEISVPLKPESIDYERLILKD